jgi:serine/threonine protein kinase/tetratricopeptide (TPR) repeat protein
LLETIFQTAAEMTPELLPEYLNTACGDDAELRREVESLLASAGQSLDFLAKPIQDAAQAVAGQPSIIGQRIGPYRVLRALGKGGMGTVYLAARADDHYDRQVAIKLMSTGFGATESMQARFRSERQILANLDHPNIARLLDGGVTSLVGALGSPSVPYLVMEYVDGVPIDEHCRRNGLSIADRLRLFRIVCAAVEYAHNNLVVHRDIKPANILVSAAGAPKLLDFGIAKLLDPDLGDTPLSRTKTTQRLMTPEYASPEQIRGDVVTTASDVYELGVLLYELLARQRPFRLSGRSPLELAAMICDQQPEFPSASLAARPDGAGEAKKLKGDLDNIVLKAMHKEPGRRYASVALLSSDVLAYLEGYPLLARTNTWGYRAGKFVRRHKLGVASVAATLLALVGFSIGMGLLAKRTTRDQFIAQRQTQFLSDMFQAATPEQARGNKFTARDLLDRGAQRVDKEFASEPQVRASLLENIASAYRSLGVLDQAETLSQRAYDLQTQIGGANAPSSAGALEILASVIRLKGQYQRAEPLFRRLVDIRRKALGNERVELASALSGLGECLYLEAKDQEAEPIMREGLAIYRHNGPNVGSENRNYLALLLERKGKYAEAVPLLREAVEIDRRTIGTDTPEYAISSHNLASVLIDLGDLSGAESRLRETLVIRRKVLGNDHPDLFYSLNNLAFVLLNEGNWKEAEPFAREALALNLRVLGKDHPQVAGARNGLARVFEAEGKFPEADQQFQLAMDTLRAANQSDGWYAAQIGLNRAMLELDRGHFADAESISRQSLEKLRKIGGNDAPAVATALIEVAQDRIFQYDPKSAEPLLREALAIRQKTFQPGHATIIAAQTRLGEALIGEGESAEAEPILQQAVGSAYQAPFPMPVWQVAEAQSALGACLLALGRRSEAENLIHSSQPGLQKHPRPAFRRQAADRLKNLSQKSAHSGNS